MVITNVGCLHHTLNLSSACTVPGEYILFLCVYATVECSFHYSFHYRLSTKENVCSAWSNQFIIRPLPARHSETNWLESESTFIIMPDFFLDLLLTYYCLLYCSWFQLYQSQQLARLSVPKSLESEQQNLHQTAFDPLLLVFIIQSFIETCF